MRLLSTARDTQVVVVRALTGEIDLRCCAAPLRERRQDANGATPDAGGEPTHLDRRYVDDEAGIELLCTKAGTRAAHLRRVGHRREGTQGPPGLGLIRRPPCPRRFV